MFCMRAGVGAVAGVVFLAAATRASRTWLAAYRERLRLEIVSALQDRQSPEAHTPAVVEGAVVGVAAVAHVATTDEERVAEADTQLLIITTLHAELESQQTRHQEQLRQVMGLVTQASEAAAQHRERATALEAEVLAQTEQATWASEHQLRLILWQTARLRSSRTAPP